MDAPFRGRRPTGDPGIDLAGRKVPRLLEQLLEASEPTVVVARQVDLARQLLHAEAENVDIATEQR